MRALLKFLSFAAIVAALYYTRYHFARVKVEESSSFFMTEAANKISDGWSVEEFNKLADNSLKSGNAIASTFESYRKLGALTKPAKCTLGQFTSYADSTTSENYISANYECRSEFEKGPATMYFTILRYQDTDKWKISNISIVSPYFSTPAPQ